MDFKAALAVTTRLHERLARRRPAIAKFEQYFDGQQRLAFASDSWRRMHSDRYRGFADNWCGVVGRAAPERTQLLGIRVGDDVKVQTPDERALWGHWVRNNGEAQSSAGFLSGAVTGRSFVTVWGDESGDPLLSWEHSSQCIVEYDELGRSRFGLKAWMDDAGEHVTLYTPDEVWKWSRDPEAVEPERPVWAARLPEVTGDSSWPIRNPLGVVPIVEMPNRPVLGSGPISDISGTMAMQDAVNLMWAYLFSAADYASMPARVIMGQEPPKMPILDESGQKIGEQPVDKEALENGRMLWLTGTETSIGQWDAAKLDVFTDVLHVMVKHLASQTRTPIHYIMGELGNVNGETLTATELPLAYKVREGHKHLTHPVREVFRRIALVNGDGALAEACRTARLQWANPETATDSQVSDAALKDAQIGWSFASILEKRYGLSQQEISDEMQRRDAEQADPYLSAKLGGLTSDSPTVAAGSGEVPDGADA